MELFSYMGRTETRNVSEEKLQFSDTHIENILHKPVLMPRQRNYLRHAPICSTELSGLHSFFPIYPLRASTPIIPIIQCIL